MKNETKTEEKTFTMNDVGTMIERFDKSVKNLSENIDKRVESVKTEIGS